MTATIDRRRPGSERVATVPRRDRASAAVASAVVVAVAILPALATRPRGVYDTFSYMADPSISSGRLPLVPTLYWLAGHDVRVAAAV